MNLTLICTGTPKNRVTRCTAVVWSLATTKPQYLRGMPVMTSTRTCQGMFLSIRETISWVPDLKDPPPSFLRLLSVSSTVKWGFVLRSNGLSRRCIDVAHPGGQPLRGPAPSAVDPREAQPSSPGASAAHALTVLSPLLPGPLRQGYGASPLTTGSLIKIRVSQWLQKGGIPGAGT